ncbi:sugar phosphate isomerase/epimerase family protein [Methanolobus halotolerans]|uniref:Sugar phosphate isomerase/epimerase n=1 Tax=Methanolobus halotolerans TaxID=2052935 RepID=A0A4E0PUT7_9EURY|nr:sugar phosphate isomerase/epimerase [Methanolobus halotolerans]TGC07246.1 sugar phosphate isomerase/epimerase [Methanolobus halotolerans]
MRIRNLSFSSREVVEESFEWVYDLEDLGYVGWEIVQEGSHCLNEVNLAKVKEIRETTNLQMSMHLPFSDMNLAGLNEGIHNEVLRQMKYYLQMASGLVEVAVLHPGYLSPYGAKLPERSWQTSITSVQMLCDFAAEIGITIAVENMPNFPKIFGQYPDEMLDLLEKVDRENVGMTLDVGHANTMGFLDEFVEKCKGKLSHMHIHDNHGEHDEHLPLGQGNIDWKKLMENLSDYKGLMVTEMAGLEEGRQCIEYLKSL